MNILIRPEALSLSGNIEKFRIASADKVSFVLAMGAKEILSSVYTPGSDGFITIDVRDIVESQLTFLLKDVTTPYEQSQLASDFTARLDNDSYTFRVIRGGVDRPDIPAADFLKGNFLTWQPQVKPVTYYSPEFLTYYSVSPSYLKVKAYFPGEGGNVTDSVKQLASMGAGRAYTVPVQYAVIAALFGSQFPSFYDIWAEDASGNRLTYVQRYVAGDMLSEQEQWILFENSLGGIDCFRAYGQSDFTGEHTHNIAEIDEVSQEYRVDTERKFQKSTGFLDDRNRRWLLDFFPSRGKYVYLGNYLRKIVLTESDVSFTDKELPSEYKFTYRYADARPYLNLPRTDRLPANLTISVPELGSFSIPPRLIEFPSQPLSEGVLFPVQNPYSEDWSTATIGGIFNYILNKIGADYSGGGGIGHAHINLDLLQLFSYVDEYLLVNGKKIKAGWADQLSEEGDGKYIHKDRIDRTDFLLQFGEFIDSMLAGKGTGIFPDGRIQTGRLEVRGSMTVMDLIINQLQGIASDFIFSDCGKITSVEYLGNSVYKLTIDKRTDFDFLTFGDNDVVFSIVNTLLTGGTDYYTSWLRVLSKNINDNTVTCVLYPDSEVPGGRNYPPASGYNLARRGNAIVPESGQVNERAQSWLLSSREGRISFLQNVFKPILEDYNYALTIGRFPKVKMIEKLPISPTDVGIMAKTIVAEHYYQADWNGDIIPNKVDRGEWSLEVAQGDSPYRFITHEVMLEDQSVITQLEQHTVYHSGCKWGCIIDKTLSEPMWRSPGWTLLEGDKNYHLEFTSSNGWQFFRNGVNADITAVVSYGNRDITNILMATLGVGVEWLRDTKNAPADNSWRPTYVEGQKHIIRLSSSDMGSDWGITVRTVRFICRISIPVGEKFDTVENYVGFKI